MPFPGCWEPLQRRNETRYPAYPALTQLMCVIVGACAGVGALNFQLGLLYKLKKTFHPQLRKGSRHTGHRPPTHVSDDQPLGRSHRVLCNRLPARILRPVALTVRVSDVWLCNDILTPIRLRLPTSTRLCQWALSILLHS